ncbi:MAG: hypothetical protein BHV68_00015 [Bacteroidales bacterium 43_8]|nr:MAG: hypothetical protein BHV68_00015 [Bacteroidales bacterium 43_8]
MSKKKQIIFSSLLGIVLLVVIFMPKKETTEPLDEIEVTAKAYAKSVEILNENEDLILSDNYFDMNAGTKRVKIEHGDAGKLRLRSV